MNNSSPQLAFETFKLENIKIFLYVRNNTYFDADAASFRLQTWIIKSWFLRNPGSLLLNPLSSYHHIITDNKPKLPF